MRFPLDLVLWPNGYRHCMTQGDLTNEQQAVLESLLPTEKKKPGRPSPWLKRQLTDDIR